MEGDGDDGDAVRAEHAAVHGDRRAAEHVDALERAMRRAKKLRKEGKGSSHGKCYSD
jgi:hypothetical protein